jgi:myo-inositol-1(or 4)-monophosphatase
MDYLKEVDVGREAAFAAAEVMNTYLREGFEVKLKGKNDLVTQADLDCEKAIIEIIKKYYPDDHFLAEETHDSTHLGPERTWIIDPIDGTTNFAHCFPVFCTSIALWEAGEAKAAVVYQAGSNEMFTAAKGSGALLNEREIRVSGLENLSECLIGTGFPYKNFEVLDHYLQLFKSLMGKTQGVRRPGAASYDLCCVAAGRFDGFYEHGLSAWDVAAGSLIIQEAGGVVSDWLGENNWLFGQRFLAGNPAIHKALMQEIHLHFDETELKQH